MNTPLTQRDRVLHALLSGQTLTQKQAAASLRVGNLRARVSEIRGMGVEVDITPVRSASVSGFTARYSVPTAVFTRKRRERKQALWS